MKYAILILQNEIDELKQCVKNLGVRYNGSYDKDIDELEKAIKILKNDDAQWLSEIVQLLNESEQSEALRCFRKRFNLVNRFVCQRCGNVQANFDSKIGCEKCGFNKADIKVIQEASNGQA